MSDTGQSVDVAKLLEAIEKLTARVDELETHIHAFHPPGDLPEDVLLAISAACAAYLGHRAKVRQVHVRRRSNTWASVGRADVQQSHRITHGQTW